MTDTPETTEAVAGEKKRTIEVRAFVDPKEMATDCQIRASDLNGAFMDQAALLVHYGQQASKAALQVDRIKQLVKVAEAQIDKELRDEAAEEGKKLTEAMIEKAITRHPKMIQLTKALNEAKHQESLANVAVEGMRHRRDMLVQLGAQHRSEMQGEIRVAMGEARAQAEKEQRARVAEKLAAARAA
jgi:hypothetical protein